MPERGPAMHGALFDRLGGRATLERVIDAFYDRIEADPELRPLFPADLGPGREKQQLFLEQWLGGAPRYAERYGHPRLRHRHLPFRIDAQAAERWLRHMEEALTACGVDADTRAAILQGLAPLARHMINAGEDIARAPLLDITVLP